MSRRDRRIDEFRATTTEQGFEWERRGDRWRVKQPNGRILFAPVRIRENRAIANLRAKLRRAGATL